MCLFMRYARAHTPCTLSDLLRMANAHHDPLAAILVARVHRRVDQIREVRSACPPLAQPWHDALKMARATADVEQRPLRATERLERASSSEREPKAAWLDALRRLTNWTWRMYIATLRPLSSLPLGLAVLK